MKQVGRLALRHEGNFWNAYYADACTMDGAALIGSIAMGAIAGNPERKRAFMDLMKDVVAEFISDIGGIDPEWADERRAPEHERGGHA
ncbi:MAG: hypothetical protein V4712_17580 [Pseudomonadota bacterium]